MGISSSVGLISGINFGELYLLVDATSPGYRYAELVSAGALVAQRLLPALASWLMTQTGSGEFEKAKQLIGVRIRELRLAKGLSQERLAAMAGCDRT